MLSDTNHPCPPDVDLSGPMKPRKRELDDITDSLPAPKRRQPKSLPPTPSPKHKFNLGFQRPKPRSKQASEASPQSEPKPSKRAFATDRQTSEDPDPDCDLAPASKRPRRSSEPPRSWVSIGDWLENTHQPRLVQGKAGDSEIIPTIERPFPQDIEIAEDQMSEQLGTGSVASARSGKFDTLSSLYRRSLKMNRVVVDNFGSRIPLAIQQFVTKHIRKKRGSPPLGDEERARIIQRIEQVWDNAEPTVSSILETTLFPLRTTDIGEGGNVIWSTQPLPCNPEYPYCLTAPKTDRHLGYHLSITSDWTSEELSAADHIMVQPYSQPTKENLFPSFLIKLKSEASQGTLYAAESQLASGGAHRIRLMIWMLDTIDPLRTRSSIDAIIFLIAVSQRQAVAHVHYFNPTDNMFYMSFIDSFYYAKDVQGCHDFINNIVEWLVEIQRPIVRDSLKKLYPITKRWKKGRSASIIMDPAESFMSEDERPPKSQ